MKIGINKKFLAAFILIFIIEVIIAVFINDNFIRPYLGDILVILLIYCLVKSFVRAQIKLLPLYIFIFASLVEVGQYFDLAELMGLGNHKIIALVMGSTFDLKDIACYLAGCIILFLLNIFYGG